LEKRPFESLQKRLHLLAIHFSFFNLDALHALLTKSNARSRQKLGDIWYSPRGQTLIGRKNCPSLAYGVCPAVKLRPNNQFSRFGSGSFLL
jgi:hypothetical protein